MLIFLYGKDTYRSRRKLKEIIENYRKVRKSGLNLKFFQGSEINFQDFKDEIQQTSMFKEKKLFILENSFSNLQFKKEFLENKKYFLNTDHIILFYEENEIPKGDFLFSFLKDNAKCQEFEELEGLKLKSWTKKEFHNFGAKIEDGALEKLLNFVGSNLWMMENEVKKLASFKNGKTIEEKDVELLVNQKIETDIFKTIEAIAAKNKKKALQLLKFHLEKGDSLFYLFSMITYQFRNLLIIKSQFKYNFPIPKQEAINKKIGMNPYVFRKTFNLAGKFSFEELKKIYQKIFETDLFIKTGKIELETALDLLIAEI